MFGGFASLSTLKGLNAAGISSSAGGGGGGENKRPSTSTSTNAEKKPRVPKHLTFPRCTNPPPHEPFVSPTRTDIQFHSLFQKIKRPTNISPDHLRALNVHVTYDLSLDQLIPTRYHPNETDEDGEFTKRRKELEIENRLAFQAIARTRRDVKVGNFYRFYQALEFVSTYYEPEGPESGSIPGKFREDAVKNLLDPMGWSSNVRVYPPRAAPKILMRNSLFDVRSDQYLFRLPIPVQERKENIVEGPLFVVQNRHEDSFDQETDVVDTLREVAALIHLGQERGRKRGSMNRKIRCEPVGRENGLSGDDLFLISSINHHISISHVFLSDAYLNFVRTGERPSAEFQNAFPDWHTFRLGKSKWLNYLDPNGRIDCLRHILSLINYLMRDSPNGTHKK